MFQVSSPFKNCLSARCATAAVSFGSNFSGVQKVKYPTRIWCYHIYIDIFVKLQLGCHPVAVVQYTFTHKQYTERHKTNNTQNNTKFLEECWPAPLLCELYPGICLTTGEKARKNLSQGSRV